MIGFILFIKEKSPLIWRVIKWVNGIAFSVLYRRKFNKTIQSFLNKYSLSGFEFNVLKEKELYHIIKLESKLENEQKTFFEPHDFDVTALKHEFKNPAFIMMGVFLEAQMVGYFFLRCFINKKCFVGRLVVKSHRGKGIGKAMNEIMYHTAWDSGFRCFATISKNNDLVMKAHNHNPHIKVLKELKDDYLLVEFLEGK